MNCDPDEFRGLHVLEATTDAEIWQVAQIRNACRAGYSHDRETLLTPESQRAWWVSQEGHAKAWLFYDDTSRLIGFGMLRPLDDERITTIVGVLPEARGHDYGLAITRYIVHQAWAPIWATGAVDNPAAVRLHDPGHWTEVESPEPGRLRAFEAKRFT